MIHTRRLLSGLLALALTFAAVGCKKEEAPVPAPGPSASSPAQSEFDLFVMEQFRDNLEADYTSLHQTLVHPESYDIDPSKVEVTMGQPLTAENLETFRQENDAISEKLAAFPYEELTPYQQETYDMIRFELDNAIASMDGDFAYMQNLFSPMGGLQNSLATFFMEYDFYKPQDVADYITLMKDTPNYIGGMLEYTKIQAEKGFFMSQGAADQTIAYCDRILKDAEDSAILKAILHNIDSFGLLSPEQKEEYKQQASEAFHSSIIPSYEMIRDTLSSLRSDSSNQLGLAHLPKGKDYYEILFRTKTGTFRSIEDVRHLLEQYIHQALYNLSTIAAENREAYDAYLQGTNTSGFEDYPSMEAALEKMKDGVFPPIHPVSYTIDYLDPQVSVDGVSAYYVVPPLDGDLPQKMKVNPNSGMAVSSLGSFSTAAHEGIPGHLYHHNYMMQNLPDPFRQTTSFIGYNEGYATYVELLALEWLDLDPDAIAVEQNYALFQNCMIALSDIGIHYDGWTKEDMQDYFDQYLKLDVSEIYDQIQANPGAFLPYYVGHLEFLELRKEAENALGNKFREVDFHTAILKSGSAPFEIVAQNVEDYITNAR